jgi:hypothetical protein
MNLIKSETNNAIITTLDCVREHPNADRLKLATVLGTQVIVDINSKDGDLVIYFDSNLRLSHDYLHYNNLYSNPELNVDTTKKGYFGKNGRVRAQRFRGEVSNGFVAELESLHEWIPGMAEVNLKVGDEFTHINSEEICGKYFVPTKHTQGKPRLPKSDMFHRHWDTKQLMREKDRLVPGILYVEEKIHGTSGRTGNVLCNTNRPWYKFWKPKQEWKIISGTRRVDDINYHIPSIRQEIERKVAPHLHKGEQIYYEIYGYDGGKEIQSGFHYDCRGGEFKTMLYRVTITTPDGYSIDLNREQVYKRAVELGLEKPVPVIAWAMFEDSRTDDVCEQIIRFADGKSELDAGTLREGIVIWFKDRDGNWEALKYKSEEFLLNQSKKTDENVMDIEDVL